jgi:hypothetical protein
MVINRRTFMQGAALLSTGGLLSCSADLLACASPTQGSPASQTAAVEANAKRVFKVDGWERVDLAGDEVFIQVNRAWRTAWR